MNSVNSGSSYFVNELECKHESEGIKYYDKSVVPIYADGNLKYIVETLVDVTERVQNRKLNEENKLMKAQYDLLTRTIENLEFRFILISYPDIKIKYMNKQVLDLLKEFVQSESLDSIVGKSAYDIFGFNQDEIYEMDTNLKKLSSNNDSTFVLYKSSIIEGKEKHFKIIHQPICNSKNEVTEIAMIGIDITRKSKPEIKWRKLINCRAKYL